ncbi:MAG: translation initiation factor IF-3 [Clostridiales bacterium]|nr:translation initiation factor IF-3 [Clostridiales bacterium]MBQ5967233.1 translation initiation factor IF-3 [Clostridiales bacterium]MBQ6271281.1 translation initiation factor IF-3 [Clostridiales bacterium]MBR5417455.1 translation initiation factor IF-3 [Clostridiales bacterium]MCR5059044.1 translation initiation factor IF-3 [Clostridiales bacterium]
MVSFDGVKRESFAPFLYLRRWVLIARQNNGQPINEEIRFEKVRLIDADGTMVGIVPIEQARKAADLAGLDLVLIANNPDNPVCKVMDYGKYLFEQAKREKEARKNQKVIETKEVGMKLTTEDHDLNVKTKNACRFLKDGNRVKVIVKFRGREMAYQNQGYAVMEKFASLCAEVGQIDKPAKIEGRNMVMFLAPKKN